MREAILLIVGLLLGAVGAWLVAKALAAAERRSLEEQLHLLEDARTRLSDAFKALSADVLGAQSETFLQLAKETFNTLRAQAEGDLGKRQEAIQALVKPLSENLNRFDEMLRAVEKARQTAYGSLEELLRSLTSQTTNLATALRGTPHVRGRWGELTLRRAVELAGMVEYCDFFEQPTVGEEAILRPDMIIRLPAGRNIVVDAKVPLVAFLEAVEAKSEEQRDLALARHAQHAKQHLKQLSSRRYWEQFERTPDFVVSYFPGEGFLSAALQHDHTLMEDFITEHIIPAGPFILIALLRAVAQGWREEQLARSAQEISAQGKIVYERFLTVWNHFEDLQAGIERTRKAWNSFVGSLDERLLPSLRKFHELGAPSADELPGLEEVEGAVRTLPSPPDSKTP